LIGRFRFLFVAAPAKMPLLLDSSPVMTQHQREPFDSAIPESPSFATLAHRGMTVCGASNNNKRSLADQDLSGQEQRDDGSMEVSFIGSSVGSTFVDTPTKRRKRHSVDLPPVEAPTAFSRNQPVDLAFIWKQLSTMESEVQKAIPFSKHGDGRDTYTFNRVRCRLLALKVCHFTSASVTRVEANSQPWIQHSGISFAGNKANLCFSPRSRRSSAHQRAHRRGFLEGSILVSQHGRTARFSPSRFQRP
jgi:hypothetical protein